MQMRFSRTGRGAEDSATVTQIDYAPLPRSEITDRERRLAPFAAAAALLSLVVLIAGFAISGGAAPDTDATEAEALRVFADNSDTELLARILQAAAFAILIFPLVFLFRAAQARSDRMRPALVGVLVAGPIFLGASLILRWVGLDAVAGDFVAADGSQCADADSTASEDECVTDLITAHGAVAVGQGLAIAGILGLIVGFVYTSLYAMRTGLVTRFLGTFGMAIGVGTIFLGPFPVILFMIWVGIVAWRRSYPAWETGQAEPWPAPGRQRPPGPDFDETVEGRADEIFPDAAERDEPEPGSIADEVERAGRKADSESEGPQKRKKRG